MTGETINLKNHFLIAMPNLDDPIFDHTVTLVCSNDNEGSFGVTMNRPLEITLGEVFDQLELPSNNAKLNEKATFSGGPVEAGKGLVVHDGDGVWEDTLSLSDELSITASRDILNDIIANKGPDNFLLALGCASWEPQQLEDEVMDNVWLTCPASNQIIFDLPYKQRWDAAARSMGVDLNRMSYHIGHA